MRRIIFDVPRWSVYLHREARSIDQPDQGDPPRLQFEDELFERIYAGAAVELPDAEKHLIFRTWAEQVHTACDQHPSFARLRGECRGDADAAAAAVESLVTELAPPWSEKKETNGAALRRSLGAGCERAAHAVDDLREILNGAEHVAFGVKAGSATRPANSKAGTGLMSLARRIRNDERLRRILLLAGRFKRIAARKRRQRAIHGADEIADVEQGADIARFLPAELAKLAHPRFRLIVLRDLVEKRCLQYQLRGTETLGKGPLVVCLDKSGSMDGEPDEWAIAVALALLEAAHRQQRSFALLGFDGEVKFEAFVEQNDRLPGRP